ncbi:MAG: N-acetyltransferase, partial [Lentisphaeria bacterium]|nr:N-acetyltransferase [Lentisphaeria bacterium]
MPCDPEKITYSMTRMPDPDQVIGLYRETGWITEGMDVSFVPAMLKNSFAIATAYEGNRLIGMMRALSDGVSDAYLLDLVVAADCRK